jgi:hypothetical protein
VKGLGLMVGGATMVAKALTALFAMGVAVWHRWNH